MVRVHTRILRLLLQFYLTHSYGVPASSSLLFNNAFHLHLRRQVYDTLGQESLGISLCLADERVYIGTEGLSMQWPPAIRSRTKEEVVFHLCTPEYLLTASWLQIQEILNQGRLDLTKHRLRQSILPKGKFTCSLDASPMFSPKINGFRGRWISRIRDRIRATHAITQSLVYGAEV